MQVPTSALLGNGKHGVVASPVSRWKEPLYERLILGVGRAPDAKSRTPRAQMSRFTTDKHKSAQLSFREDFDAGSSNQISFLRRSTGTLT